MSLKPIQEGRLKSTVKKKTVKNLRLVGRLEEGLFRTGALSQVIKASDSPGGGTPIHYLYGYVPPNGVVILKPLI